MVASRGGVALQKIKISQKFSGFEKLLLVGGIKGFRTAKEPVLISVIGRQTCVINCSIANLIFIL
jgi:hypothetical protein